MFVVYTFVHVHTQDKIYLERIYRVSKIDRYIYWWDIKESMWLFDFNCVLNSSDLHSTGVGN